MITLAALMLAGAAAQVPDSIYSDNFDTGYVCPNTVVTPTGVLTRRQTSYIQYLPGYPPPSRPNVDLTDFDNIWGHITSTDLTTPWPGVPGSSPTVVSIGRNEFVAAKFHIPADTSTLLNGSFKHVMYGGGPDIDFSISQRCGDFEPMDTACAKDNVLANDRTMLPWKIGSSTSTRCGLMPDHDYYVNIRFSDPETTGPDCSGQTCQTTIQQYVGY